MLKHNDEWTHFFRKIYFSHFILKRVDIGYVWEVSWRRGQTATYWPQVPLTIAALFLILLGCSTRVLRAQALCLALTLTTASCPQLRLELELWLQLELNSACFELQLTQAVCGTWLYNYLIPTCFMWAYVSAPNSNTSTGQGDIFNWMHLFLLLIYTGASINWQLGRGSIC